ncbi:hypothetical protein NDN08_006659 [Rhodosorus marinus]|uniref:Protein DETOXIFICATION n=1 Tax=Rhodosorus marinus TaxID=101924 RepID=A0AAV8ULV5_9RHOD|nr:hypothetical protein NDN08_006659 [Rhodosorus marinus]
MSEEGYNRDVRCASFVPGLLGSSPGNGRNTSACRQRRTGRRRDGFRPGPAIPSSAVEHENSELVEARKPSAFLNSVRNVFRVQELDKEAARLALPAVGSFALEPSVSLVNTAFIARLGHHAIGSVAIGKGVFNLFTMPMNFLGIATLPRIAAESSENPEEASRILASTLLVAFGAGIVIMIVLGVFTVPISSKLGASSLLLEQTSIYLRYRIISAPVFLVSNVAVAAFRAFQDTATPLGTSIFVDVVNLALHPFFMFYLGLGVAGAAIAQAATQLLHAIVSLSILIRRGWLDPAHLLEFPAKSRLAHLARDGFALTFRSLSIISVLNLANVAASMRGSLCLAAFEVQRQIWSLLGGVLDAISVAGQSIVPVALGKKDYAHARRAASRLLQIAFIAGCVNGSILILAGYPLAQAFASSRTTLDSITSCLPIMAVFIPLNAMVFVLEGVYSSARRFGTLSSTIVFSGGISALFLIFLQRHLSLGLGYIWVAVNLMMALRFLILSVIYKSRYMPIPKVTQELASRGEEFAGDGVSKESV